ncbi:crotonobetainyl-CoA:carnitine CoA-transferase CaiB-like acyl-CoA transferase [Microbacterium sp. W4I4]|uniref:CaiB/BaiF CoA transferase family protein n=1 Tax=Microbacterium sp. W4I4 TaxID=3042295 RepID=UPI0027841178|nr:CoA transferase [Microbacterium sp. W4I4]MDQ0614276.1 crotonobetainyl-CoA:carnitine CoA-transferase CaiB-like acyl-CoA transferase [Microbacterium sp. W4I4]
MTPRPLAGRRVIDLSQYIAGPACGQLLADFGADVIKVEPLRGDPSRLLGDTGEGSVYYRQYNTGKQSIRLDIADAAGRAELERMLDDADAVIMNFAARTRAKLGLDWETLHARHPGLVVTIVSAYGIDDPRTALDAVVQADSGFAMLNADADGSARISSGYPTDVFTGLYAGISTAMALTDAARGGGMLIDVPMIEVALSALCGPATLTVSDGAPPPVGSGSRDIATAPSTVFEAADGPVYIYAGLDKTWDEVRMLSSAPDGPLAERLGDRARFEQPLAEWASRRTADEVLETMRGIGVAAAPVRTVDDALAALHADRPGAVADIAATGRAVPQFPVTFSGGRIPRRDAMTDETNKESIA